MPYRSDNGGFATTAPIKLQFNQSSTWATRLSQIGKNPYYTIICTTALPDVDYAEKVLSKANRGVILYVPESCAANARELKKRLPWLCVFVVPTVNVNLAVIEPFTVWLSSDPLGKGRGLDASVGIHSEEARIMVQGWIEQAYDRAKELN